MLSKDQATNSTFTADTLRSAGGKMDDGRSVSDNDHL